MAASVTSVVRGAAAALAVLDPGAALSAGGPSSGELALLAPVSMHVGGGRNLLAESSVQWQVRTGNGTELDYTHLAQGCDFVPGNSTVTPFRLEVGHAVVNCSVLGEEDRGFFLAEAIQYEHVWTAQIALEVLNENATDCDEKFWWTNREDSAELVQRSDRFQLKPNDVRDFTGSLFLQKDDSSWKYTPLTRIALHDLPCHAPRPAPAAAGTWLDSTGAKAALGVGAAGGALLTGFIVYTCRRRCRTPAQAQEANNGRGAQAQAEQVPLMAVDVPVEGPPDPARRAENVSNVAVPVHANGDQPPPPPYDEDSVVPPLNAAPEALPLSLHLGPPPKYSA